MTMTTTRTSQGHRQQDRGSVLDPKRRAVIEDVEFGGGASGLKRKPHDLNTLTSKHLFRTCTRSNGRPSENDLHLSYWLCHEKHKTVSTRERGQHLQERAEKGEHYTGRVRQEEHHKDLVIISEKSAPRRAL